MQLNNTVVKGKTFDTLLAVFPLAASVWEVADAVLETVSNCTIDGWCIHIPITGILYTAIVLGMTVGQYAIARAIARKSGWSSHTINSGLELAMLAYSLFT